MTERKMNKIDANQIQVGDLMAFIHYARVDGKNAIGSQVNVTDIDNGTPISVNGKDLIEKAFSANQFTEEEKVTKTQAAELLISSPNRPLSVSFMKSDGTERVIRGRLVKPEPLLGRSMVEDLETTDKNRLRQVDHRTINWLIVDGVKYVVK